jgi:hypothetical protein
VLAAIVKKKEAEERQRQQLEELINKLHFEEAQKKQRDAKKAKEAKLAAARLEMLRANDYQLQLKAQRRQKETEVEEENNRRMLQKFAEDDKVRRRTVSSSRAGAGGLCPAASRSAVARGADGDGVRPHRRRRRARRGGRSRCWSSRRRWRGWRRTSAGCTSPSVSKRGVFAWTLVWRDALLRRRREGAVEPGLC